VHAGAWLLRVWHVYESRHFTTCCATHDALLVHVLVGEACEGKQCIYETGCMCNRTDLYGSWKPGKSKLRTFNAMLDQEGPAQTSLCSEWAVHVGKCVVRVAVILPLSHFRPYGPGGSRWICQRRGVSCVLSTMTGTQGNQLPAGMILVDVAHARPASWGCAGSTAAYSRVDSQPVLFPKVCVSRFSKDDRMQCKSPALLEALKSSKL
jgi:hypothetical protein